MQPEARPAIHPELRTETIKAIQPETDEKRGEVAQFPRPVSADAGIQLPPLTLDAVLRGTISDQIPVSEPTRAEIHERNVAHVRIAAVNPPVPPVVNASAELPKLNATKASEALLMQVAEQRVVTLSALFDVGHKRRAVEIIRQYSLWPLFAIMHTGRDAAWVG